MASLRRFTEKKKNFLKAFKLHKRDKKIYQLQGLLNRLKQRS